MVWAKESYLQGRKMRAIHLLSSLALTLTLFTGCGIYSFQGGKLKAGLKTVTVELVENKAKLVNPTLALDLTEKLKDKFISQSSLRLAAYDGDLQFSGTIIQYDVKPIAIQGNETAASNRLTIAVKVEYDCEKYPEDAWEKSFSQFADFSSTLNLSDVEADLVKDIIDRLSQDIFNKVLSNW
jgi:hypothetical protein